MTVKASLSPNIISSQELEQFIQISGDNNSIHLDAEAAAKRFTTANVNSPVVHGVMILGKVSAYVTRVFGDGTVIRKIEDLVFRQPLQVGQSFLINHEVLCTRGQIARVNFWVFSQGNDKTEEFASGTAVILLP